MLNNFSRVILIIALVAVSACAKTTNRHSQDFYSELSKKQTLVNIPAKAQFQVVDFAGKGERMYNYEYTIENLLGRVLVEEFNKKGYKIENLSKGEAKKKGLLKGLRKLRKDYYETTPKLQPGQLMKIEQAYRIDEKVGKGNQLGKKAGGSIIVVADYNGTTKTGGARAKDFMMDMLLGSHASDYTDMFTLTVSLVENESGKILWMDQGFTKQGLFSSGLEALSSNEKADLENVQELVGSALRNLPNKDKLLEVEKEEREKLG